jgi:hypothetical protein
MSYRVEQEGFEYRGYKLGQNVVYEGKQVKIIGFDEEDDDLFIAVNCMYQTVKIGESLATVILQGMELSSYDWAMGGEITNISVGEINNDEENLPPSISPIHVPDILTDILNMDWTSTDDLLEIHVMIQRCIDSLNSTQQ